MKVVLINPPENLRLRNNVISTQYPINLGYLAAVLKQGGVETEIWDYVVEPFSREEFITRITKSNPQLIGITVMTNIVESMSELVKIIKERFKDMRVVAGGTHVSALPEKTMEEVSELDYVCIGEGEYTLLELCGVLGGRRRIEDVKGLVYRLDSGSIVKNEKRHLIPDLEWLPYPDRSLVDLNYYRRSHTSRGISRKFLNVAEILTARGCPNQCIFCAGHVSYGNCVRFRSSGSVLAEMRECIEKYKANHFTILDDTFTLIPTRTAAICTGLKKFGVTWDCSTRVNNVTKEILKMMAESGCKKVSFGVEASTDRMLKLIKKGITLEQVRRAVKWAKEAEIKFIEGTFILGAHPSETRQEVDEAVKLMKELDLDFVYYGIIVPLPGTEVYQIMDKRGYLPKEKKWKEYIFSGSTPPWRTDNFSSHDLVELQRMVLRKFYIRPSYFLKMFLKISTWVEVKYYFDVAKDFFKYFILKLPTN